jgi:hypothetical protein
MTLNKDGGNTDDRPVSHAYNSNSAGSMLLMQAREGGHRTERIWDREGM